MTVWVNGEEVEAGAAVTLSELALQIGLDQRSVLIEHNGVALRQREWPERRLSDGDHVEFIRVVAGG